MLLPVFSWFRTGRSTEGRATTLRSSRRVFRPESGLPTWKNPTAAPSGGVAGASAQHQQLLDCSNERRRGSDGCQCSAAARAAVVDENARRRDSRREKRIRLSSERSVRRILSYVGTTVNAPRARPHAALRSGQARAQVTQTRVETRRRVLLRRALGKRVTTPTHRSSSAAARVRQRRGLALIVATHPDKGHRPGPVRRVE